MATARFIATLRNTEYRNATVSHSVRRASIDRAVFHAQIWLLKTQRLKDYCGITYDAWEIATVGEDGTVTTVEGGGVTDAEKARMSSASATPGTDMASKHNKGKRVGAKSTRSAGCHNQHERWVRSPGTRKTPRTIATENMTYSQRRLQEMRETARRANGVQ